MKISTKLLLIRKLKNAKYIWRFIIFMGGVFHETFVSFVTFEEYMFKDSNLLCLKEKFVTHLDAGRVCKTEGS